MVDVCLSPTKPFYFAPGDCLAAGSFSLLPDLDMAYCQAHSEGTRVVIQCDCVDSKNGQPIERCACLLTRYLCLIPLLEVSRFDRSCSLYRIRSGGGLYETRAGHSYIYPISRNHQWSGITQKDSAHLNLIESCMSALEVVGIAVEHVHTEVAPGQWGFVLSPDWPLPAIDALLKARVTIRIVARLFGVHATWHPRLRPDHPGTGAHVHLSLYDPWKGQEPRRDTHYMKKFQHFMAGVLQQFPAIMAFSLLQEVSYERVKPGIWGGGEYAGWGLDNKKAALCLIEENNFKLRMINGLANQYLVLAAMPEAGEDGIEKQISLVAGQVETAPAKLPPAKRKLPRHFPRPYRRASRLWKSIRFWTSIRLMSLEVILWLWYGLILLSSGRRRRYCGRWSLMSDERG